MPTGSIDLSLIIRQAFSIIPDHTADVIGQIKGKDLEDWNFQQKGVIVSMPVLSGNDIETHLAFFSTDLQGLLLHIAHCVWGIGAMKGCKLFGKYDLIEIFDRWSINRYRALECIPWSGLTRIARVKYLVGIALECIPWSGSD